MAIIKTNHQLEQVAFTFDDSGEVTGINLTVNYALEDDVTGDEETRVRKTVNVWDDLTDAQKAQGNAIGKHFQNLAERV